jgi:hypothetical protein
MALETATYISGLVSTNPTSSDNISEGDNHLRLIKSTLLATFPNVTGAITKTHTQLNTTVADTEAATSANTVSTLVKRDASGNFSAGVVTADVTGDLTGNASTADAWSTSRTITLAGDLTGSVAIDGSANVTLTAAVANDSHNHDGRYFTETEADARFLGISANAVSASKWATARTFALSGDVSGSVSFDGSANATLTATVADDSHNHIIGNVDGLQAALDAKLASSANAVSASKWLTARTVALSGDVSGSASIDGSANVTITTSVAALAQKADKDAVVTSSSRTAAAGELIVCNSASALTITLPSSPGAGDAVAISNIGTATVTVARNGSNIGSAAENGTLAAGKSTQLVYVNSTIGWGEI